jgi:uncharacterized protein
MTAVAVFSLLRRDRESSERRVSSASQAGGYSLTSALANYGGWFSGGYFTMLTQSSFFVSACSLQAVATTKVINVFSSLIATATFALRGVVDYKLGLILGPMIFAGGIVGGPVAMRLPAVD